MHLVLSEVLHARGGTVEWVDLRDGRPGPAPLYLRHPDRNFWFTFLEETGSLYLQFNQVYDMETESIREFASRLSKFIEGHPVEQLVVDLRRNRGGDQSLAKPLLHAILCSKVNETGRLFALTGRTTFSAAMKFALWLEEHTHVLYAGEPTGSSPNNYGDSRKIFLPHTNLTIRASTRYYQYDPTEVRPFLPPHVPVALTVEDYAAGRDPVLEALLDLGRARKAVPASPRGVWSGFTSPGLNYFDLYVTVAGPPDAPSLKADLPALEIKGETAEGVSAGQGRLAFTLPSEEGAIGFEGAVSGDWLIGEAELRSRKFPFVLRKAEVGPATP